MRLLTALKEAYLIISLALIAGAYWPWAQFNDFALRPFTEAIALWLILGLAPIALAEWLGCGLREITIRAKALASR